MTTTTTFSGMEPGAKNSSRVLRPPGGASNISFGTDEEKPVRKNKMASNIFAEPDDPHAHRRNNPPGGAPTGILCGEPSAPLRRCQQPLLFPKSDGLEQTNICNSPAKVEVHEQENDVDHAEEAEPEQEPKEEASQPSAPSGGSSAGGRRNPPGGKSSLILG